MTAPRSTEPFTIRAPKQMIDDIDALAAGMDRSRNDVVNQALQQFVETHAWQLERIKEGVAAAEQGRVRPAEDVFAEISAKYNWDR